MGIKPYRIEIQQGNFISQEMISQLKLGMSKDQVRYLLGTPLITDSFHAERWDYVFRRQRVNSTELEHRKLAVFFEDGKLKRIEGDAIPAAQADSTAPETAVARPVLPPDMPDANTTQAASGQAKPAHAGVAGRPGAETAAPAPEQPQEKSWWQKLKEKF
ncbi:MAG: outer membrane protein assembly factor BamE [Burkholderiales bacterium]|nr:outer membrane protein assembly factor BamE [Burkholderiales bacterium]